MSCAFLLFQSASPVIDGLDSNGMIMYRLFRDATRYTDGVHLKVRRGAYLSFIL